MQSFKSPFKGKRKVLKKYLEEGISGYKTFLQSNPDAIFALDLNGYFSCMNPSCMKISGYSFEELAKLRYQNLISVEYLDTVFNHFYKAIQGEIQNYDCKLIHKSGKHIYVNVTNAPICVDDEIVGVYCVVKDLTELKQKNEELRKVSQIYSILAENSVDTVTITNLEGEFLFVSPTSRNIIGFTPEELLGISVFDLIHKEDIDRAMQHTKLAASGKEKALDTYRMRKKDGSYVWIETLSKPIIDKETKQVNEIISISRDITERKLAEEAIKRQEERYRNLVEHSPDALMIIKNAEIIYINNTGLALFGAAGKGQIIGKEIFELLHADHITKFKTRIKQLNAGNSIPLIEKRFLRVDGSEFTAEIKGIPTIQDNKRVSHLIIRDIEDRKKTQELLLHSEKLSVTGQLAAGIAHEVRNPLTSIKGFLQLMKEKSVENKVYYDIISSEINRIELILTELLTLAKPQKMVVKKVYLRELIEQVKTLLETQAIMNNIEIVTVFKGETLEITCDENQLKQVFINLFKNSIEAMSNGGTITVGVYNFNSDKIKIICRDTGKGIPDDIINRIGEPFFTTKDNGTGLGLMISKQIIEGHNGELEILSNPNGTTIKIVLPNT